MARDPADVGGRESQIQRVHDAAGRRDAEVALEERVMVPAERGDAVAFAPSQSLKRRAKRAGAAMKIAVAMPAQALVRETGDDLGLGKQHACALEQMIEGQR